MPANISAPKHHGTRRRQSCDVTGRTRLCDIFPVRASQQLTIGELLLTQLKLNALRRPATLDAEQGAETSVVPVVAPLVGHLKLYVPSTDAAIHFCCDAALTGWAGHSLRKADVGGKSRWHSKRLQLGLHCPLEPTARSTCCDKCLPNVAPTAMTLALLTNPRGGFTPG